VTTTAVNRFTSTAAIGKSDDDDEIIIRKAIVRAMCSAETAVVAATNFSSGNVS
jgi:hypothetical protein